MLINIDGKSPIWRAGVAGDHLEVNGLMIEIQA
jgi:hypothetical protein